MNFNKERVVSSLNDRAKQDFEFAYGHRPDLDNEGDLWALIHIQLENLRNRIEYLEHIYTE